MAKHAYGLVVLFYILKEVLLYFNSFMAKTSINILRIASYLMLLGSFWSCEQTPEHIQHIPATANWVIKLSPSTTGASSFSQVISRHIAQTEIVDLWKEMMVSASDYGVSVENGAFIMNLPYENQLFYCLFLEVVDEDKLTNSLMGITGVEFGEKATYQFAQIDPANWIAWTEGRAVALHALGYQGRKRAEQFMDHLMRLPVESGLAVNDDFLEMATSDAEAGMFVQETLWADFIKRQAGELFKGTIEPAFSPEELGPFIANVRVLDNKTQLEMNVSAMLTLIFRRGISTEMLELIPQTTPDALIALALDVDILEMLIDEYPLLGRMMDETLLEIGIDHAVLLDNWTGQLLLVNNPPTQGGQPEFGFLLNVKDIEAFQALAERKGPDYHVELSDEWVYLSTSDYSPYTNEGQKRTESIPQLVQRWGTVFDGNGLVVYSAKGDTWLGDFSLLPESDSAWELRIASGKVEYVVYDADIWNMVVKLTDAF